jgi:gamma-glutamyltranspeptidase/glutathione hydrolase
MLRRLGRATLLLAVLGSGVLLLRVARSERGDDARVRSEVRARVPAAWPYSDQPRVATAGQAMVVTDAPLATAVGVDVLRAGGNAVDAAVAIAFALAVVYPEAGNIGGGGFLLLHTRAGESAALDFRETAPAAAHRDMYLDAHGELTDRSVTGHLAAGVPGAVAGLWEMHRRFGTRDWAELLAPAIRLARDGFSVDERLASTVRADSARLARFDGSAALFLPDGRPPDVGTTWRNPDLGAVLERVAQRGPAGFYAGETADRIVDEMRRGGGIITHEDLRTYRPVWREPVDFEWRGHRVLSMPPPSSGGLTLALVARILEGYDARALGWRSPAALHLMAEAMRRAFADRNHDLGDPDFVAIPTDRFLSREYAARQRATIRPDRATPSAEVHPGMAPAPPAAAGSDGAHTTHFSVVDASGNAVALTTTINELYGSAVTVSGAGFLLNNEMDDFAAKPGAPNLFGLVQGERNAIAPGRRMLSAMTPTIVLDAAGRPVIVTGARGGPRIITAVYQVLSNLIEFGLEPGLAVYAPRIHHQHLPDILYFERNGVAAADSAALEALGHTVRPRPGYIGNAPTIVRRGDLWVGVADPRVGGRAAGY